MMKVEMILVMEKKTMLKLVVVMMFFSYCLVSVTTSVSFDVSRKNNVLVFVVDDGGFLQSAYNNSVCDTPNLDALASRSVVFSNGYTSVSSCSPSRSVLLTGLPQHQNGMYGLHHSVHHFNSFDQVKSLPRILSKNGILTGLIGKKHVGPDQVYKFDYERSNEQYNIDQIGRNITFMKTFVREFLNQAAADDQPFFLYIGFFDTHRGPIHLNPSKFGPFREKWGSGLPGMGSIPDWTPHFYDPAKVIVPYFLPDTSEVRKDLAAMYASFNRMDQGVGLFLSELQKVGRLDDTLILLSGDNGIPFPNAKTNLYEPGQGVPMLMSSPLHRNTWGTLSDLLVSTLDFVPTILDWLSVPYPHYKMNGHTVNLSGSSLLSLLRNNTNNNDKNNNNKNNRGGDSVTATTMSHASWHRSNANFNSMGPSPIWSSEFSSFNFSVSLSSHNLHEITMYYPMRVVRSRRFRLIHNLNYPAPYPIALDIFTSPSFQDILNRTKRGQPTHWFKTLPQYYQRAEWEMFDLEADPSELTNLAYDQAYQTELDTLKKILIAWQQYTADPWLCLPHQELVDSRCVDLLNQKKEL